MDLTDLTKLKIMKEKWCQMMLPKSDIWNAIFPCFITFLLHFFVTLIRIKSSHNAIYAINYCRTKVTWF